MSRAGASFTAASGDEIPNEGQMLLHMQSELGANINSTFQAAKVTRPLMAVSKICDNDNSVTFDKTKATVTASNGIVMCVFT